MNKYIRIFREACQKLEEDIGNPSIMQAIDYDIDNAEIKNDKILNKEFIKWMENLSSLLMDIDGYLRGRFKGNKKLKEFKELIREAWRYGIDNYVKDPDDNEIRHFGNEDHGNDYDLSNNDNPQNQ